MHLCCSFRWITHSPSRPSSSGTEHDVQERWQPWPTTGSVEWAWPMMPRLEVRERRDVNVLFLNRLLSEVLHSVPVMRWSVHERAKGVHSSDEPNQMRITPTTRSGPMVDFFKCSDTRHERRMPSTPQDIDGMFYGLLWCRHLAVLIFLWSNKTQWENMNLLWCGLFWNEPVFSKIHTDCCSVFLSVPL